LYLEFAKKIILAISSIPSIVVNFFTIELIFGVHPYFSNFVQFDPKYQSELLHQQ
jgi:hypothetical protein